MPQLTQVLKLCRASGVFILTSSPPAISVSQDFTQQTQPVIIISHPDFGFDAFTFLCKMNTSASKTSA